MGYRRKGVRRNVAAADFSEPGDAHASRPEEGWLADFQQKRSRRRIGSKAEEILPALCAIFSKKVKRHQKNEFTGCKSIRKEIQHEKNAEQSAECALRDSDHRFPLHFSDYGGGG